MNRSSRLNATLCKLYSGEAMSYDEKKLVGSLVICSYIVIPVVSAMIIYWVR